MKIDIELATFITDAIDNFDASVSLHTNYSGRGMFGRECFGVSSKGSALSVLMQFLSDLRNQNDLSLLSFIDELSCQEIRSDSLGLDTIIYWPNVEWPDLDEEDEQ